jgi:signal transduction histidine kinase
MLIDFVLANRAEILSRVRARVLARGTPSPTVEQLDEGLPLFLDQLATALRTQGKPTLAHHETITKSANVHGSNLWSHGFTVRQVVHDYGDICQVITDLAVEQKASINTEEYRTLNLCLDDAIAGAVDEYAKRREGAIRDEGAERLGVLVHELRNLLSTATLAYESVKKGVVGVEGSTGLILGRSLIGLRNLVDRSLADARLEAGLENIERVPVGTVLEEVEITASVLAQAREINFSVDLGDLTLTVAADRQLLTAAVANLVQNAFKFTRKKGSVSLRTRTAGGRVLIDVEDECGGLPPGKAEEFFKPHHQQGADRTGLGLGLSICLKTVRAIQGDVYVKNLPGKGCIFTIDLPREATPPIPIGGRQPKTEAGAKRSARRPPPRRPRHR